MARSGPIVFSRFGGPARVIGRVALAALLALFGGPGAKEAHADVRLYDGNGLTFDGALTVGVGFFSSPNANFGAGTYRSGGSERIAGNPAWFEGYSTPELKLSYYRPDLGQFYGDVSAIGAMTRGAGDANLISLTSGNPTSIAVENAYVGWRSGRLFGDLNDDALDVSAGRQSFQIGDGFLIGDGTADAGRRGAYILGPRTAFSGLGIVRINTEPVRGDVFALTSSTDQTAARNLDQPQMGYVGANVEWFDTKSNEDGRFSYTGRERYVGAMALHAYEADRNGCFSTGNCPGGPAGIPSGANRDGLTVLSARAGGSLIAAVPNLSLYGEYAFETNSKAGNKVNANAWYAEPGWSFSKLPWTPRVFYRYSHFSGDPNPNDDVKRSFDPLFYTGGRDYGTWFLGEVAGQYLLFNSNDNVHQLGFTVNPTDDLKLGILLYDFFFDRKAQAGVTNNHVMTEMDLTAQWAVSNKLSLTGVFGIAQSGAGGRQFIQNSTAGFSNVPGNLDRIWMATELMAIYKF